jgi:hypothetical protein
MLHARIALKCLEARSIDLLIMQHFDKDVNQIEAKRSNFKINR